MPIDRGFRDINESDGGCAAACVAGGIPQGPREDGSAASIK